MSKDTSQKEGISNDVQDIMRYMISAIRAVKLYPPNNPNYSQSIKKSFEVLDSFLKTSSEYRLGVQKNQFTFRNTPFEKDAQLNRTIAQDLFAKELREVVFTNGLLEGELLSFYKALALPTEDLAMRSGISSVLWENGSTHIKVTESGLDEVISSKKENDWGAKSPEESAAKSEESAGKKKTDMFAGRTLVLGALMADPEGFGASMVELAKQTRADHESVEDRLYTLYQEAGQKIAKEHADQSDELFEGLAKSVLSLEPHFREGLVAGKLYANLDSELATEHVADIEGQLPNEFHEIQTGRFSNAWNVQEVATLLKRNSARKAAALAPTPMDRVAIAVTPIPPDFVSVIAKDMAEYTPGEMEELKAMSEAGTESAIIQAAVRTLINLIPLVKKPYQEAPGPKEIKLFSGIIRQLEDLLGYLQKKKDYDLAAVIIHAFHEPVEPAFKQRMGEAQKKLVTKPIIIGMVKDMRAHAPESEEYRSAYEYLKTLDRAATMLLLDLLAEEEDRSTRLFLITILKDLGKNQIALIGEQFADKRWYVVRNAVRIMGDTGTEQSIGFLYKIIDHKDIRIREEVMKALIHIGGKKAASLVGKFLKDTNVDMQGMALRSLGEFKGLGDAEAQQVVEFLEYRPLRQKEQKLTLEAIGVLGRIGGRESADFLKRYGRIKWWKKRTLQAELRTASLQAIDEITGRQANAGRTKR